MMKTCSIYSNSKQQYFTHADSCNVFHVVMCHRCVRAQWNRWIWSIRDLLSSVALFADRSHRGFCVYTNYHKKSEGKDKLMHIIPHLVIPMCAPSVCHYLSNFSNAFICKITSHLLRWNRWPKRNTITIKMVIKGSMEKHRWREWTKKKIWCVLLWGWRWHMIHIK